MARPSQRKGQSGKAMKGTTLATSDLGGCKANAGTCILDDGVAIWDGTAIENVCPFELKNIYQVKISGNHMIVCVGLSTLAFIGRKKKYYKEMDVTSPRHSKLKLLLLLPTALLLALLMTSTTLECTTRVLSS
uniref:Uncharacterized protein n=1 Tax=Romanomermis culicivorax TaxID=13658 RepID=A0A915HQT2_ROMCU